MTIIANGLIIVPDGYVIHRHPNRKKGVCPFDTFRVPSEKMYTVCGIRLDKLKKNERSVNMISSEDEKELAKKNTFCEKCKKW